jgi:hypothetical protein
MIMSIANTFPVFEPDQVLTNRHLNDLFNYLDQQDRLTRCKLLGSGIVCGLDISHTTDTINITKGCGLTSQGYIILFCDHIGANGYKFYMPFTRPPIPKDIHLIFQCGPEPSLENIPFYSSTTGSSFNAAANNSIFLLLTKEEFDALDDQTGVIPLSQSQPLDDYAVVLFLDINELSLKNCDTNNCNDKGSRMELEVKPLLVHKKLLNSRNGNTGNDPRFRHIELRRYNVPVQNLTSTDDVLNAFLALLDDSTLERLALDLEQSFNQYRHLVPGINSNPFGTLTDLKENLDFIINFRPVLIQYYYDFVYDLILALYEFRHRIFEMNSECCFDEMSFPFHLTLGEAVVNTSSNVQSAYRQYFIYSPLFDRENERSAEIRSLLMRMILMYQDFLLTQKAFRENRVGFPLDIRITPSQYSHHFLSERCIPYYYKVVHDQQDAIPEDLYYYWNYHKTRRGNARYNLSYNAFQYNHADTVIHPLNYDIEWYNFFRIEGHIGRNINSALVRVKSIQQNFNLPFDVVALSADHIGALVRGQDPECVIQDLESDYRVLIAEFICRLHHAFCFIGKLTFTPPRVVIGSNDIFGTRRSTETGAAPDEDNINAIFPSVTSSANIVADHPFISSLVSEFQATAVYRKGDTLMRLCAPNGSTFGRIYTTIIERNDGKFVNPVPANDTSQLAVIQRHFFEFLDSIEGMFYILMTEQLSELNTSEFQPAYTRYESEVNSIRTIIQELVKEIGDAGAKRDNPVIDTLADLFVENVQLLLQTCIVERLEAIKNEYLRRLAQYRLAKNFNFYFKNHGGIEHKAGVPRGGTFLLVYKEERRRRFVDVNSLFINKELSNLMLAHFRELLQPDINLDTQEAKARILAVSTMYKDPQLYFQFKDVMQKYLDDCKDLPDDKRTAITNIINQPPAQKRFEIPDGVVIADFYIPYICCSDCPPIVYVLSEQPSITIAKQFCRNDKGPYTIEVSPAGGVIKIDGQEVPDGKLTPSAFSPGTHTITYTVNDKTVTTTFEIVKPPNVKLSHRPTENNIPTVVFILNTNARDGALFNWDYGDGQTLSTTDRTQLTHEYLLTQAEQQFNITLTVTDGPCKVIQQDSVVLTSTPIP